MAQLQAAIDGCLQDALPFADLERICTALMPDLYLQRWIPAVMLSRYLVYVPGASMQRRLAVQQHKRARLVKRQSADASKTMMFTEEASEVRCPTMRRRPQQEVKHGCGTKHQCASHPCTHLVGLQPGQLAAAQPQVRCTAAWTKG